jgi:hypothetical protein
MKSALLATVALLASSFLASAAQVNLGAATSRTPYDPYMRPVRQVLRTLDGEGTSMERVQALMRQGNGFRYSFVEPYVASLPSVTAARRAGDCKDKALWLCDQINDENVRFVVGKARSESRMSHAWVMWQHQGRWWILDCTNTSRPIPVDSVSRRDYIPLYSWGKEGAFRHFPGGTTVAAVAGKRSNHVGSLDARR